MPQHRLFAALVVVEVTDVIFAVDSVPAILAVSHEPFLVFASNAFAILGLRAMYFLLANAKDRFHYLSHGLGGILIFVGVKMAVSHWFHLNTYVSLAIILAMLTTAIFASRTAHDRGITEPSRRVAGMDDAVLYEQSGHVVTITYNRPERLNAINGEMREGLNAAWARSGTTPTRGSPSSRARAVHFAPEQICVTVPAPTGTWPGTFWEIPTHNSFESGWEIFKPIIAAVNGPCIGYGLTAVSACDFVIASDRATFAMPEVRLGVPTIVGRDSTADEDRLAARDGTAAARPSPSRPNGHATSGSCGSSYPTTRCSTALVTWPNDCAPTRPSPNAPSKRSRGDRSRCRSRRQSDSARPCARSPRPPTMPPKAATHHTIAAHPNGGAADSLPRTRVRPNEWSSLATTPPATRHHTVRSSRCANTRGRSPGRRRRNRCGQR